MFLQRDRDLASLPILVLLAVTIFQSCATSVYNPRKSHLVIREANSRQLLSGVKLWIENTRTRTLLPLASTDSLGYARIDWKKVNKRPGFSGNRRQCRLICEKTFAAGGQSFVSRDTVALNEYMGHLDLYLEHPQPFGAGVRVFVPEPVADMHYHVSMKTHNLFGHHLYADSLARQSIPANLNLFKDYRQLRVFNGKKWKKPFLGEIKFDRLEVDNRWYRKYHKMKALLDLEWVKPKSTHLSNNLIQYTQATHPNLVQGGMHLAYNAISPFEHGVSNTFSKRLANNKLVTRANMKWLQKIGHAEEHLTHWENFRLEYDMINQQADFYNFYDWQLLRDNEDLLNNSPKIVMVLEGAHVLQDKYFPHILDYNIANRNTTQDRDLLNQLLHKQIQADFVFADEFMTLPQNGNAASTSVPLIPRIMNGQLTSISKQVWKNARQEEKEVLSQEMDRLLMKELTDNIDTLKSMKGSPVAMVTVAHLTYNGMFGHAPNLNGGGFITRLFARKNYNIRVSDDRTYRKQWTSVFFAIPGVNKFGKVVLDRLVSRENGHRILIDLKHCDYTARAYFFDSVMIDRSGATPDTIPPICSHCAVTGLPGAYYSPLMDEFSLLEAPSTTTFYPFGINLYDEEISKICQNNGIIGIPLFQNVLGANINKKRNYPYRFKRDTVRADNRIYRYSRQKGIKDYLGYLYYTRGADRHLAASAFAHTENHLAPWLNGLSRKKCDKRILQQTVIDYISAEPFLQNLFYIIDHSGHADKRKAWKNVCIGSDLDGLIDPIDVCPTASGYPNFKARLIQFIPIFLEMRKMTAPAHQMPASIEDYFHPEDFPLEEAIDQLFYDSLYDFSVRYLLK